MLKNSANYLSTDNAMSPIVAKGAAGEDFSNAAIISFAAFWTASDEKIPGTFVCDRKN